MSGEPLNQSPITQQMNTLNNLTIALGILALVGLGLILGHLTAPSLPNYRVEAPESNLGASGNKTCTTSIVALSRSTGTQILANNTARRSVNLVNPSSTPVFVKRGLSVTSSTGVPLTTTGASWSWNEDNDPYTLAVTAISPDATSTIVVESCI